MANPDKSTYPPSRTTTTEYGYFIRKKTRYGKRKRQKTEEIKANPEKLTLGKIGNLEFYVYPDKFPDKVFFGIYPLSDSMEEHQTADLLRLYNRLRWYFAGYWQKSGRRTKWSKRARVSISNAYNYGANKRRGS